MDDEVCQGLRRTRQSRRGASGPLTVPTISLERFLHGSAEEKAEVARLWDAACAEVGFLRVVGHGVPLETIETMWEQTTAFFDRPLEEKRTVQMSEAYPYGYTGFGGENLQASLEAAAKNPPDAKEMFSICLGGALPAADLPPPQWPPASAAMQAAWRAYYAALSSLAASLYQVCALALGLPIDWFEEKITRHRDVIRAINYPEQPEPPPAGQVRASVHTDYGALTILRLGGEYAGGLQVMGVGGEWVDVETDGLDAFVINLGDLMARWTNDRWLSTPHRVVNPPEASAAKARRQSIAYFCNINMDAVVECIPTCVGEGAKYEPITAGEHLMKKHLQTVAGQLCYAPPAEAEASPQQA
mmetsp:Transcript_25739/g.54591  ORF Transcript_25739/g.54591 Transcript_25739/m.54591 type:complete len:358 (+) Transcript_25739:39-1112(+)